MKKMLNDQLVDLTPAEQAQYDADQISGAAQATAQATVQGNADTIRTGIGNRMAGIRTARTALANGTIFASLSTNEKAVIDGLLQDDLYLGRIVLNLYDGTG
jgi:hypothetical protein